MGFVAPEAATEYSVYWKFFLVEVLVGLSLISKSSYAYCLRWVVLASQRIVAGWEDSCWAMTGESMAHSPTIANCSSKSTESYRLIELMCWTCSGSCCTVDLVDVISSRRHAEDVVHSCCFVGAWQRCDVAVNRND